MQARLEQHVQDGRIQQVTRRLRREPWLRLDDLSRISGLSASRLQHLFKEQTGMRIGAFTKHVQVARIKRLLLETSLPLKEIGKRVGIADVANLGRYFKQYLGCTPAAYRRRFRRLR
jgi:AraC family transcriptional regulator of arabinose operon